MLATHNYSNNKLTMANNRSKRKRLVDESVEELDNQPNENDKRIKSSQDLIGAARKGDIHLCINAIRDGADVRFQACGLSPLFYAAFYGHNMIIDYLMNCGAEVNEKNPSGITPLAKSVEVGLLPAVKCLISHGADPNIADAKGITPLMKAAKLGRLDLVMCLVNDGKAMIDYKNDELNTALSEAAFKGSSDIVKFLLDSGASVNLANALGKTALHRAVSASKASIVGILIDHNATVDAQDMYGFSALHYAAFHGALECAKTLMEKKKANLYIKDKVGKYPQDIALARRHFAIVDFFRDISNITAAATGL